MQKKQAHHYSLWTALLLHKWPDLNSQQHDAPPPSLSLSFPDSFSLTKLCKKKCKQDMYLTSWVATFPPSLLDRLLDVLACLPMNAYTFILVDLLQYTMCVCVCALKRYQVLWINHYIFFISYQMLLATEVIHYLFHASHLFSIYWYCVFLFRDAQATHPYGMWCSRCVSTMCFTNCKWLLAVLCKPHTKSWAPSQESVDASGLWQHMTASAVKHRF